MSKIPVPHQIASHVLPALKSFTMKDPVSEGLNLLAVGLRPYVAGRVQAVLRDADLAADITAWDAQSLMIFMWDRWNDLFRNELSFVERSLISELRDFRNRWAHQDGMDEGDVYRVLDDIERLLKAIHSHEIHLVGDLRRESLHRLWLREQGDDRKHRLMRVLWPYLLCACSAAAMSVAVIYFGNAPWSWLLSGLLFLAMMRVAYLQSMREARRSPGPHECSHCGRIIYSVECPYCSPKSIVAASNSPSDGVLAILKGSGFEFSPAKETSDSVNTTSS